MNAAVPAVDPTARSLALIGIGHPAAILIRQWTSSAAGDVAVWSVCARGLTQDVRRDLDAQLAVAVVGWRLMLAGPGAAVSLLRAQAIRAGAESCEIRTALTSVASRRVYCVHCRHISDAEVELGGAAACPRCGLCLTVRPHFSARLAAYLGVAQ